MMKNERGFSLIELIMVTFIFGFVLAASSDMFVGLLRGYKQQSKIAETNIEGIIGLEMLRRDIDSAGYGLPWQISGVSYQEATNANATVYNDQPSNPPRAIVSGDGVGPGISGADYLVIKAMNVASNSACTKWTDLKSSGTTSWDSSADNLNPSDRVIVISPGTPSTNSRSLVGFSSSLQFSGVSAYASPDETRIVYGVDPDTNLIMPFNRADYYISRSVTIPGRCAQGTGVLVKQVVNQSDGSFSGTNTFPLLDCVADMQVSFLLDRTGNNSPPSSWSPATVLNDLSGTPLTAQQIRDQLKEVRVDILAHEGQRDPNYDASGTYPTHYIMVGQSASLGRNFDFTTITNWQNYRWKIYTLIVKPSNLR